MTTILQWLAEREPAPPQALLRRLHEALGSDGGRSAIDAADVCLAAAERVVGTVVSDEEASRDHALDLLTADALVTYAFEAASSKPGELPGRAAAAMEKLASLGVRVAAASSPRA